jgi:transcriptional regulator with XRE-family HTH domain
MLIIGNQLKAARALIGIEQQELADAAKVHVNTIRKMEAKGLAEITSAADVLRRVQHALEAAGVEFTNGDQPGVRLRRPAPSAVDPANTPKPVPTTKTGPPKKRRSRPELHALKPKPKDTP